MERNPLITSFADDSQNSSQWLDRVIIRQIARRDLIALEWGGEFSHFRQVYENAFQRTKSGLSLMWVAEILEEGIIGQAFVQLISDRVDLADGINRAYLYSFRVKPEYRNLGVGTKILDTIENDLIQRGFKSVTLNVAKENVRAQGMYLNRGYQIIAPESGIWSYPDEKGVWHKVVEPAWRMEKFLQKNQIFKV
jgi:ribosomal protein S18 acetylase RimI-like enzyme